MSKADAKKDIAGLERGLEQTALPRCAEQVYVVSGERQGLAKVLPVAVRMQIYRIPIIQPGAL